MFLEYSELNHLVKYLLFAIAMGARQLKKQGKGPWTGLYMRYPCPNIYEIVIFFIQINKDIMYVDFKHHI